MFRELHCLVDGLDCSLLSDLHKLVFLSWLLFSSIHIVCKDFR
eukprot:09285.XXX_74725_74850_1 [CDS] Oithona nana genome sequencing.